jgi:hypothetical protein
MRWVGHIEHLGERTSIYSVLVGKPEGKETAWKNLPCPVSAKGRFARNP